MRLLPHFDVIELTGHFTGAYSLEKTGRQQIVRDLCSSEKQFHDRIRLAEVIYKIPLR